LSTILAVDDSATMRKCLEITFAGTEFNLVAVETAQEALANVKTLKPDLVIADSSLPPNDGYELCSTIKLAAPEVPVLMLSSKQHPFDAQKGAQADAHLDKPFDTQLLQDKARELVQAGGDKSDTDVPGAPAKPQTPKIPAQKIPATKVAVKPSVGERTAAASSKIPAPRRKRPTPAVMTNPLNKQPAQKQAPTGAAAMRRTVPFAMPGSAKRQGGANVITDALKKSGSTQPIGKDAARRPLQDKRASDTLPGVPQPPDEATMDAIAQARAQQAPAGPGAVIGDVAIADLETKLGSLGLTNDQMQGVLALSRDIIEQVVWEVVPTLAETLIKEEIKRLTGD
jgi:CheY-like chemotaxis protein